jgi:hypothetical protein
MLNKSDIKQFGWQGFVLEIPQNCKFVSEGGDINTGFMRFDAEKFQFEIKWDPLPKKFEDSLSKMADKLIQKVMKKLKIKSLTHQKRLMHINGHDAISIYFRTNIENYFIIWLCRESERIIMTQFVFHSRSGELDKTMQSILESLKCHGFKEHIWSVLNFTIKTPKTFQLKMRKLMVGRTLLTFLEEKRTFVKSQKSYIIFELFSLANIQFKETYNKPRQWIEKYYLQELKDKFRRIKFEKYSCHNLRGHRVLLCFGKASSGFTLRRNSLLMMGVWYCPETIRICVSTVAISIKKLPFTKGVNVKDMKKLYKKVVSTVICH